MSPRKPLGKGRYGEHGRSVTLWVEGDLIRAQWRERGRRRKRSWANTPANRAEAKAWAERFGELRRDQAQVAPLTTAELWTRYREAEYPTLRPRSQQLYHEYWRRWEVFAAAESIAEDLGPGTMAAFRAHLEGEHLSPSTIGQTLRIVKMVYAWGYRHRVLARNDVRDYRYKVAKERRATPPAEYRAEDFRALLTALDTPGTWRAHAVLALCGYQGVRQNAVLHLRWEDVDFEARAVTWRGRWDKVGREWIQPLRAPAFTVLRALHWRQERPTSGWVFPAASGKSQEAVYSAQSLWAALRRAEQAARIPHLRRRAAHGLRRMLFNDVLEETQDIGTAMAAIGDSDLRVASRYLKRRDDRLEQAFAELDAKGTERAPEPGAPSEPETQMPIPQGDGHRVSSAPRRNRTYNLAVQGQGPSGQFPEKSSTYGPETPAGSPEAPPNPESKEHPNGTETGAPVVARETDGAHL